MAIAPSSIVRASAPLARTALDVARSGRIAQAMRYVDAATRPKRSAAMPAAVRIERARSTGNGVTSEQTALTLWFGEGPALPAPGQSAVRSAARLGAGVAGALALAALTAVAARREEQRHLIDATATPRR